MPDDPQQPAMPPWVQSGQGDRIPRMHEEQRRRWFAAANSGLIEPVPVAALAEAQPPAATAEGGRDNHSSAFFSTPGTEKLYSGTAKIRASASATFFRKPSTATGKPRCSTSAL